MKQPFYKTEVLFRALLKRDWLKLLFWILGMLAFAASGAGKWKSPQIQLRQIVFIQCLSKIQQWSDYLDQLQ